MREEDLRLAAGLTTNMIANMGKGKHISMDTLTKICETLDCGILDVIELVRDEEQTHIICHWTDSPKYLCYILQVLSIAQKTPNSWLLRHLIQTYIHGLSLQNQQFFHMHTKQITKST